MNRHLGRIDHERRVVSIASTLFDLTNSLHGLDGSDLRMLRLAAMVHDVGRAIDDETHPQVGARLIREADDLPLTGGERRWLAYLTNYHKGRVPVAGCDRILRRKDDHRRLLTLLAILRAADAMDSRSRRKRPACASRHAGPATAYHPLRSSRTCFKARRVYTRRKKFRLLEELLDCRVEVSLGRAKTMQLVA